ncbi:MAG: hypothetical protein NTW21_13795 [Verrucomicrobia bacterium]|nr:hypothetical protein [Verrucomicrobiota bacterium]
MRIVQHTGFAPLPDEDREAMLRQHIPYRIKLLKDAWKKTAMQAVGFSTYSYSDHELTSASSN